MINFRVLASRQLAAGVSIAALLGLALYGSIFVLPIFLQSLHGLTANQTGLVILPGAIASAITMAFVGRNANRLDARATVTVGAVLFFVSTWRLSRMTLASGPEETFWPLIMRGVGLGLICTFAIGRLITAQLYQVSPQNPLLLLSVTLILCAVALIACLVPARHAALIDPIQALRIE